MRSAPIPCIEKLEFILFGISIFKFSSKSSLLNIAAPGETGNLSVYRELKINSFELYLPVFSIEYLKVPCFFELLNINTLEYTNPTSGYDSNLGNIISMHFGCIRSSENKTFI